VTTVYDEHLDYWLKKTQITKPFFKLLTQNVKSSDVIVDLGCGGGRLGLFLSNKTAYVGIDFSEKLIAAAKASIPEATFITGDLENPTTYAELPDSYVTVSNSVFRKDSCRIEKILPNITPTSNLIFRIQGQDDLPSVLEDRPFYSESELRALLPGAILFHERYTQKFSDYNYFKRAMGRIGLCAKNKPNRKNINIIRHYILVLKNSP